MSRGKSRREPSIKVSVRAQAVKEKTIHLNIDGSLPEDYTGEVVWSNGDREWYKKGKRHRDGDLPAYIYPNGDRVWFKDGVKHRGGDEPAYLAADGYKEWWHYGMPHRTQGPAVVFPSGETRYWLDGSEMTKDQWKQALRTFLAQQEIEKAISTPIRLTPRKRRSPLAS